MIIHTSSAEPGVPYNGTVVAINQVGSGQGEPQLFFTKELSKWPCIMEHSMLLLTVLIMRIKHLHYNYDILTHYHRV